MHLRLYSNEAFAFQEWARSGEALEAPLPRVDYPRVPRMAASAGSAAGAAAGAAAATQAIADNPDVVAQAAALAQSDVGLVRKTDPGVGIVGADEPVVALTDSAGRRTWQGSNGVDGGPNSHALALLESVLWRGDGDAVQGLADQRGEMTVLATDPTTGLLAPWAARAMSGQVAAVVDAPWSPGVVWRPVHASSTSWAAWGSSTIGLLGSLLTQMVQEADATMLEGGVGGERYLNTLARAGATHPRLVFPAGVIPAGATSLVVWSPNLDWASASVTAWDVTIDTPCGARVSGQLRSTGFGPEFTRTDDGPDVPVPHTMQAVSVVGESHAADMTIIQVGKNNLDQDADSAPGVVAVHDRMVWHLVPLHRQYLLLGQHQNTGEPADNALRDRIDDVNGQLQSRHGALFVDVEEWITSGQIWADTGTTPTIEDSTQAAIGNKPPSLSMDDKHWNTTGSQGLIVLIKRQLNTLGWASFSI